MIYFDNAATGGEKHRRVTAAATTAIEFLCANPSRSGHRKALAGLNMVHKTRKALSIAFGCENFERVIFTKNCTEALNIAILGTVKEHGNVITTVFEHNSVLRPLYELERKGTITLTVIEPKDGTLRKEDFAPHIKKETYAAVITNCSNVTGQITDIAKIGAYLKRKGVTVIVDGAQSCGHIDIDMKRDNIDVLCTAGHKGIGGIMGSGILIFNGQTEILPTYCGGTGSDSLNIYQPLFYPDSLESGTLNLPAICALYEAVRCNLSSPNLNGEILENFTEKLIKLLEQNSKITLYSNKNACGIVAFSVEGIASEDFATMLDKKYDIAVRAGFHCAPLMHRYLGTDRDGLVRVSFSTNNTEKEIDNFYYAVTEIIKDLP